MAGDRQTSDGYRIRSRAEIDQLHVHEDEHRLTEIARRRRPTIAWWHGYRQHGRDFGSWCYLCDSYIATWARRWPVTGRAKQLIDVHRAMHLHALRKGELS